jgi:hypothetical protein
LAAVWILTPLKYTGAGPEYFTGFGGGGDLIADPKAMYYLFDLKKLYYKKSIP